MIRISIQSSVRLLLVVAVALFALRGDEASAQTQTAGSGVNEAHERLKNEAKAALDQREYQKTIDLASQVIDGNAKDHVAYYYRGSAKIELGLQEGNADLVREGIADARQAITLGGRTHRTYYLPYLYGMTSLAAIENRKEHAEAALKVADQTLGQAGLSAEERAPLLYQRGLIQAYLGNNEKAAQDFALAVQASPKLLAAHLALAGVYAAEGNAQQVLAAYDNALRAFPDDSLIYNDRGMYYRSVKKPREAVADFTKALEGNAKFHEAYLNRGMTLFEANQPAAAERDFVALIRLAPNHAMPYGVLGAARLAQGNIEGAVAAYRKVLELQPESAEAHGDLGFARFFRKGYAAAATEFSKALELDPQMVFLKPWLYWSLKSSGKGQEAARLLKEKPLAEGEETPWPVLVLRFLSGNMDANALLQAARQSHESMRDERECEAHYWIGRRLAEAGRQDQAQAEFQKALGMNTPHLSAYRGSQFELNKFPQAN